MPTGEPRRFFSIAEFAELSGLSISTVRRRLRDGSLPIVQPGGPRTRVLVPADVLKAPVKARANMGPMDEKSTSIDATESAPRHQKPIIPGPRPKWLAGQIQSR